MTAVIPTVPQAVYLQRIDHWGHRTYLAHAGNGAQTNDFEPVAGLVLSVVDAAHRSGASFCRSCFPSCCVVCGIPVTGADECPTCVTAGHDEEQRLFGEDR